MDYKSQVQEFEKLIHETNKDIDIKLSDSSLSLRGEAEAISIDDRRLLRTLWVLAITGQTST